MAENPYDPWTYARQHRRDYITPEDISDAKTAGALREEIWYATLEAISRSQCEDRKTAAFVALEGFEEPRR